jgi:hypothetical protein
MTRARPTGPVRPLPQLERTATIDGKVVRVQVYETATGERWECISDGDLVMFWRRATAPEKE